MRNYIHTSTHTHRDIYTLLGTKNRLNFFYHNFYDTPDRCQEYHNCFPFGELEETTRTSSNYVDEDYPARPEIKQSLPG